MWKIPVIPFAFKIGGMHRIVMCFGAAKLSLDWPNRVGWSTMQIPIPQPRACLFFSFLEIEQLPWKTKKNLNLIHSVIQIIFYDHKGHRKNIEILFCFHFISPFYPKQIRQLGFSSIHFSRVIYSGMFQKTSIYNHGYPQICQDRRSHFIKTSVRPDMPCRQA